MSIQKYMNLLKLPVRIIWQGFTNMAGVEDNRIRIGTHDGVFHCDEALACFMLRQLPQLKDSVIVRSRDPEVLKTCQFVVDVGGVYDPVINRYDHHQKEFTHSLSSLRQEYSHKHIKLSSAGLIYVHFGKQVISVLLKDREFTPKNLALIYQTIYEEFIEEIDALDNGVPMFDGEPKYSIRTHLGARVARLNPKWNSPSDVNVDDLFENAVALVGKEFTETVYEIVNVWFPARLIVQESMNDRYEVHKCGHIMELKDHCPWQKHLYTLEEEKGIKDEIKFVIFRDSKGSWRVQAVPVQVNSFVCRISLKKDWCGLRNEELSKISNIPGCIFCHATGFIGGNETKEGAIQMAIKTLNIESSE